MGPLTLHLKEAIVINSKRLPLYAKLSGGASIPISKKLIRSEKMALLVSWILDLWAKPYQKVGIPVGDAEYMSMHTLAPFQDTYPFQIGPLDSFSPVDAKTLKRTLKNAFQKEGFQSLSLAASVELKKLEQQKGYHAMTCHILESLIRASNLAPLHEAKARALGFKSPLALSRAIVNGHFPSFQFASQIDQELAPIQARGIPMLWQDVPHIPPH